MKARTLPLITALQIGQWRRLAAQSPHTTKWPQGMKTMDTSLSMHTLQVRSSWSCLSSSSGLGSFTVRETTNRRSDELYITYIIFTSQVLHLQSNHMSATYWKVLQAQKFLIFLQIIQPRLWPLTLLSDACLSPHKSSTGALHSICLWRTKCERENCPL